MKRSIVFILLLLGFSAGLWATQGTQGSRERTLAMIKPNAIKAQHIGEIIALYEAEGLKVSALKMTLLSEEQAANFYHIHQERPFFPMLVQFMSSGPIVAIVLEGPDAVVRNREIMGATDPLKAVAGTIRARYGISITENAVHGSDSIESAESEIAFFFSPNEIF
jgi:nucleoside-diphosphate kinase